MAVKFFGQFLVSRGVISGEQLLKAIELQDSMNIKFGEMALSMGFIKEADIERVHDAQRSEDLRFGDMSVKLGIITEDQLKQVLTKQKNSHIYIGEALIRTGALNDGDLQKYLDEFREDQAPYMIDRVTIPAGVKSPDLWEIAADLTYKMFTRIVNLQFRPGQCTLIKQLHGNDVIVALDLSGSVRGRYLLSVSSGARMQIGRAILKEDDVSQETDEVLNDTVMEFANIVCGNIAAKAAQLGKTVEINPPVLVDDCAGGLEVPSGSTGMLFPLYMADERVELSVFAGNP